MKLSENWFVDAPWAQLLCSTKIPTDTLQKFIAMSDDILENSDGKGTDEVVPSSWEVSTEKFQKFGLQPLLFHVNDQKLMVISHKPFGKGDRFGRKRIMYYKKLLAMVPDVNLDAITRFGLQQLVHCVHTMLNSDHSAIPFLRDCLSSKI